MPKSIESQSISSPRDPCPRKASVDKAEVTMRETIFLTPAKPSHSLLNFTAFLLMYNLADPKTHASETGGANRNFQPKQKPTNKEQSGPNDRYIQGRFRLKIEEGDV